MGTVREPVPVKPIAGILAVSTARLEEAKEGLAACLGPIEMQSEPVPWTVSAYYRREMGDEIWRQYVALAELMHPGLLAEWKRKTNRLEDRWRTPRGRTVNLDPGYVGLEKLVLASTKDRAHRIYLGGGIYAEAPLRFERGCFLPWPYCYPDYASEDARSFFNRVRERYRAQLALVRTGRCC